VSHTSRLARVLVAAYILYIVDPRLVNYELYTLIYVITSHTEGPWDQVAQVIGWAHSLIHQQGITRIQTDIRISTRYVKIIEQGFVNIRFRAPRKEVYWPVWISKLMHDYRTDKVQPMEGNVASVERILAATI
jgi:uncharacterized protein YqgV (UPF0045/DUF77 family)